MFFKNPSIRLDIKVDDENKNLKRLLKGEVVGCISSQPQAIIGGLCDYVGSLDYIFVQHQSFIPDISARAYQRKIY